MTRGEPPSGASKWSSRKLHQPTHVSSVTVVQSLFNHESQVTTHAPVVSDKHWVPTRTRLGLSPVVTETWPP